MTAPVISAAEWASQRQSVWSQTAGKLKTVSSRVRTTQWMAKWGEEDSPPAVGG